MNKKQLENKLTSAAAELSQSALILSSAKDIDEDDEFDISYFVDNIVKHTKQLFSIFSKYKGASSSKKLTSVVCKTESKKQLIKEKVPVSVNDTFDDSSETDDNEPIPDDFLDQANNTGLFIVEIILGSIDKIKILYH